MKRFFPWIAFCFITSIAGAQNSGVSKQIDSVLSLLNAQHQFNGTILYAEKGRIIYKRAFGTEDYRTGVSLRTHSSFNLASVTKQFISVCILILQSEGKLSLDDDVQKYIPELPYKDVKLRNLMTHTSGIIEYFDLFVNSRTPYDTLTNKGMIKLFASQKPALEFATGKGWNYCNTNYALLSSIIQRVSGQPIEKFIREKIVLPLGLKDTYLHQVYLPVPANHVVGFAEENGNKKLNDLTYFDGITGDGNLYSSVEDLFIWEQTLYTDKLVKQSLLKEAFTPVQIGKDSSYPYGFGWFIEKTDSLFWHTGHWAGFANIIYRDIKNKRTLILLSSGSNETGLLSVRKIFEGKSIQLPVFQLITNVSLLDGTNTPARNVAVRIKDDRIVEVGNLSPYPGESVINGNGKILAPGFIDTHSHLDESLALKPDAIPALNQGITSIVVGQDGISSPIDSIANLIKRRPVALNIASFTGQASLRITVMGKENLHRVSTGHELDSMKSILSEQIKKGSLGLSTGLEYDDAHFSSRGEVIELAKAVASCGGRYFSHLRSEDIGLTDALDEIINIGRVAMLPVQVSHMKIALKDYWGTAPAILAQLEQARREGIMISADCYPYEQWAGNLTDLFPNGDYSNAASAEFAVAHTVDPSASTVFPFLPDSAYAGKTLSEISVLRKETPAQTLLHLVAMSLEYKKKHAAATEMVDGILGKSMQDEDVMNILCWSNSNICTDGNDGGGHPRSFASFTRILSHYVREKKSMNLQNAIYKMTSLAAEHAGIPDRGIVASGYFADLVLFDPETVHDNADFQHADALSEGILKVWVNGKIVFENKQFMQRYPGVLIRRVSK